MGDNVYHLDIKDVDYDSFLLTTNPEANFCGQHTMIRKDDLYIRIVEEDGIHSQSYAANLEYDPKHYEGINIITFLINRKDENKVYIRIKIAKEFIEQQPKRATEYALGIALARYYRTV